jgi:oligoendopeptidase F
MSEHQPFSSYNEGPHFVFESYAIFNELLLLDHLYKTAPTQAAKAYYLGLFLRDATFQIYGSAKETDLEQSIYAGVRSGHIRTAADLNALTLDVIKQYEPESQLLAEDKAMWSRTRLFYVDPLYSVNYLFAGLLALNYIDQFQRDPQGFSRRYMALLAEGFDDTPQSLLKQHVGIDLNNTARLVDGATGLIEQRTAELAQLYSSCGDGSCATP